MKRIAAILMLLLVNNIPFQAQDTTDYTWWKASQRTQMQHFKDSLRDDYQSFFNQRWQDFDLYRSMHRLGTPKQPSQPVADTIDLEQTAELQMEVSLPAIPSRQAYMPDSMLHTDYAAEMVTFQFYCREVTFRLPVNLSRLSLEGNRERQVTRFWQQIGATAVSDVVSQAYRKRQDLYLNDWGVLQLIVQLSSHVYPSSKDAQTALAVYMLNRMQYDVRIGKMGYQLVMLVASLQPIYERPYLILDGKKYYAMIQDPTSSDKSRITTYRNQFPNADVPIDLNVYYSPRIGGCLTGKPYLFAFHGSRLKINVNKALVDFYANYPQTDLSVYAQAAVEEAMGLAIENNLRPLLVGKNRMESIALLLDYMQQGFSYRTDTEQFGHEKTLFCEENFHYGANDCEDRAVLFSYLVRRLTDLDVVLLEFDGHVAAAVCFGKEKVKGDYYTFENRRYVVCDPTTRGAKVGQLVRRYRRQTPRLIALKTK